VEGALTVSWITLEQSKAKTSFDQTEEEVENMAEIAKTMDQAVKSMVSKEGKYLTFALAGEEYGIGILKVKEIIEGPLSEASLARRPMERRSDKKEKRTEILTGNRSIWSKLNIKRLPKHT